ncbi:MAG: thioredoxin domain-containing protein [Patescibacteria group bacterium]
MLKAIFRTSLVFTLLLLTGCGGSQFLTRDTPPANTKVVVVEFSDFNCPACASASELAKKIKAIPGLYFEFRHLPLPIRGHETSSAAANAFECAREQGQGDEMESALFDNQGRLDAELFAKLPSLYDFGENFDGEDYEQCLKEDRYGGLVGKDKRTAAVNGVNSTPTFFVNGEKTSGSNLLEVVKQAFEEATE